MQPILVIARYTWLEALRSRLAWLVVALILLLLGISALIRELAITDSERMQLSFLVASLRMISVFLTAAVVISSLQRDFNDKGPALLLARAVPRSHFVLGKVIGMGGVGSAIALSCALAISWLAPASAWWPWTLSLVLEIWIIASLAVFCGISLRSVTAGLAFSLGFYLLAKSMAAIQLISHAGLGAASLAQRYMTAFLDGLALLLPRLDQYAQSQWLLDPASSVQLGMLFLQSLLFTALLAAAAMIDLYRKNL